MSSRSTTLPPNPSRIRGVVTAAPPPLGCARGYQGDHGGRKSAVERGTSAAVAAVEVAASVGRSRRAVLAGGAGGVVLALAACGATGAPAGETKSATSQEVTLVKPANIDRVDGGWRSALE